MGESSAWCRRQSSVFLASSGGQPIGSDGKPLPQVLSLAVWTVQSLSSGKSMFSRFFYLVGSEGSVTVSRSKNGASDPAGSQAAVERLKKYLEGSQEKN
jgi:hypothetical protein